MSHAIRATWVALVLFAAFSAPAQGHGASAMFVSDTLSAAPGSFQALGAMPPPAPAPAEDRPERTLGTHHIEHELRRHAAVSPVPEPQTWWMLAGGLLAIVACKGRRGRMR